MSRITAEYFAICAADDPDRVAADQCCAMPTKSTKSTISFATVDQATAEFLRISALPDRDYEGAFYCAVFHVPHELGDYTVHAFTNDLAGLALSKRLADPLA